MKRIRQRCLASIVIAVAFGAAPSGALSASQITKLGDAAFTTSPQGWRLENGTAVATPSSSEPATATFTVPGGAGGFYALRDTRLERGNSPGDIELTVAVKRAGLAEQSQPEPLVHTVLGPGEPFEFDVFVGYLCAGDRVIISIGANGDASGDETSLACGIEQKPAIVVDAEMPTFVLAPHSGYYAIHDSHARVSSGKANVSVVVGRDKRVLRAAAIGTDGTSLDTDLGYIAKGDVIQVASEGDQAIDFSGTLVEWAPRRAPLRVMRQEDGLLDVLPPDASTYLDVPKDRWVDVPAGDADATEAIRAAFARAKSLAGDGWAGVRLAKGATYRIADKLSGGGIFDLKDITRVVLDGNGATVHIDNPEMQRKGFSLFTTGQNAKQLAFCDLTVTASHVPFATGQILDLDPKNGNTQTITARLEAGSIDPLKELNANGLFGAYVYDPIIPGRLGFGTWSHYPGFSKDNAPQLVPTTEPGVFKHAVTRTNDSIAVGEKWLVKNKGGGLVYLTTRGGCEDITLSNITGRASGGGTLRFWATSGINILNCRFEPDGSNWISSSADGIHGRGREGVWVEDTTERGICEDVMNTYGRTLAVSPDDDPSDNVFSIGVFENSVRTKGTPLLKVDPNDLLPGDRLIFFSPQTGHVLARGRVLSRSGERVTVDRPVPDAVPWTGQNPRELTLVYNLDAVGKFVVRDSKFMDSMRFGIIAKARDGVIWNNTIEGMNATAVLGSNEPEWPEGPPPTNLWIQGNTFSQNNYGYASRKREFLTVDPADISIYTRRFRNADAKTAHEGSVSTGQYANSNVKIIGNTFHDWRGMGVAVRNARNVWIEDNLFLSPVEDPVLRDTLKADPSVSDGEGRYTAIYLASVNGARVVGNVAAGLPEGDNMLATGDKVEHVRNDNGVTKRSAAKSDGVVLSFGEWFGTECVEAPSIGKAVDRVTLEGATHAAGRLGAGLSFDGKGAKAVLAQSKESFGDAFTLSLWFRPRGTDQANQALLSQGDSQNGLTLALDRNELVAVILSGGKPTTLKLGEVGPTWTHAAVVFDRNGSVLRGYVNGVLAAQAALRNAPSMNGPITFGQSVISAEPASSMRLKAGENAFAGEIDEFQLSGRAATADEVSCLALRTPRR